MPLNHSDIDSSHIWNNPFYNAIEVSVNAYLRFGLRQKVHISKNQIIIDDITEPQKSKIVQLVADDNYVERPGNDTDIFICIVNSPGGIGYPGIADLEYPENKFADIFLFN